MHALAGVAEGIGGEDAAGFHGEGSGDVVGEPRIRAVREEVVEVDVGGEKRGVDVPV